MARPSLREKILQSGVRTMHELGYAGAGVREVTAAAGVPQGSFTNHFRSKEEFGLAVLDRYLEGVEATMAATLDDPSRSPVERLRAYFDTVTGRLADAGWRHGCLIGNLGLEMSESSEALRVRLASVMTVTAERFTTVILMAQAAGEMRSDIPASDIATSLMSSWQGAMLWMKVHRSPAAIDRFRSVTLEAFMATAECRP